MTPRMNSTTSLEPTLRAVSEGTPFPQVAAQKVPAGLLMVAAAVSVLLTASHTVAEPPPESEKAVESGMPSLPAAEAGPYTEPVPRSDVEDEAVLRAYRGEPFTDPPQSAAVVDAIATLQSMPVPAGEVFALVMVTDRQTGERRFFTRGTPSPELALALEDPGLAPSGVGYAESDEALANDDVEIVTRSIYARTIGDRHPLNRDKEEKRRLKNLAKGTMLPYRIDGDLRAKILAGKIDLASSKLLKIRIQMTKVPHLDLPKLHDTVTGGLLWVGLDVQTARQQAIIDRKQELAGRQQSLLDFIANNGGTVFYASWTGGIVSARLPASALGALAGRADVQSIDLRGKPRLEDATLKYQGDDIFEATDSENFDTYHNGQTGAPAGKHAWTSDIVIAQSEECIDDANPAWLDSGGGSSRATFYRCDIGACALGGLATCGFTTSDEKHGTKVAGLMVGDFMDGQDPAVAAGDDRIMTGSCPECRLLFAQDSSNNDREKVMDFFCDEGADLYESSVAEGTSCDGNGSFDASIEALADCDIVFVKGVGNDGSTGSTCTTRYPADHPWTFAVAGMDSVSPCNTPSAYYTSDCDFADGSGMGGATYNTTAGTASIVDIAGPWSHGGLIEPLTVSPVTYVEGNGNSFATPVVAGLMAEMMDWYNVHVSSSIFYENRMRNFMLLMGDRSIDDPGTSRATNFFDERWGGGRVGLVPFDDKSTWSIRRTSATLSSGDTWNITVTVPSSATFLKAVVWHDGTDYFEEPMIGLTLDPVDCATATKSVNRRDSKAMIVYNSTPLSGCTQIDVTVDNIRDGIEYPERRFHFAAYSDTEDERHF